MAARGSLVALGLVLLATPGAALGWPATGSLELSLSPGMFLSGDVQDYYGKDHLQNYGFGGVVLGVGVLTPITPTMSAGLRVEYSPKRYDIDVSAPAASSGAPTYFTDHWTADALGLLLALDGRVPIEWMQGHTVTLVLGASAGAYGLVGASYDNTHAPGSVDLSGIGFAGSLEAGADFARAGGITWSGLLGFRWAPIEPVRVSGNLAGSPVPEQDMTNDDGSEASLDHTGFYLKLAARFRLWGKPPEAPPPH